MPSTASDLYKAHVQNLRKVALGFDHIDRQLRDALARNDDTSSQSLIRILQILLGAWAECRLKKLMYESNGFDISEIEQLRAEGTQTKRWLKAIELGFRKRYQIPRANLETALPEIARMQYLSLTSSVDDDIAPAIEMRNTLAHGQWARPLNSNENDVSTLLTRNLAQENILTVRFKKAILESLAFVIHDLVSGGPAFERDYNKHYNKLSNARRNLANRDYAVWLDAMHTKKRKGREKRDKNIREC